MIFAMMHPVVFRICLYALPNTNFADLSSGHTYSSLQTSLQASEKYHPGHKASEFESKVIVGGLTEKIQVEV